MNKSIAVPNSNEENNQQNLIEDKTVQAKWMTKYLFIQ